MLRYFCAKFYLCGGGHEAGIELCKGSAVVPVRQLDDARGFGTLRGRLQQFVGQWLGRILLDHVQNGIPVQSFSLCQLVKSKRGVRADENVQSYCISLPCP